MKRVTLYMIIRTNATNYVPCVLQHHLLLRIRPGIVVHAAGGFPVKCSFRVI